MEDIISDLPPNLIESILERLPVQDAAQTTILSKKWRYIWASHPHIVLDMSFFFQRAMKKKKPLLQHEFVGIITKILYLHNGPIRRFTLCIPYMGYDQNLDIGEWMLFLSRNGINELTLSNLNFNKYQLPSSVFSCLELTHLTLCDFAVKLPHAFGVFRNLVHCLFDGVWFAANLSGPPVLNALLLESLTFAFCKGVSYFNFHAPKLGILNFVNNDEVNLTYFRSTLNLTNVSIGLGEEVKNPKQRETIHLVKFLGYLHRIVNLVFDGYFLKFLAAGTVPNQLPFAVNNLVQLTLYNFNVNGVDQISCALCLLRSSPNLRRFEIRLEQTVAALGPALRYLEAPNCMDQTLDQLQTVKIGILRGSRVELLLIKILLACSPSLEKMFVDLSSVVGDSEGFRISKELMRFSRASSKAEMIVGTSDYLPVVRILSGPPLLITENSSLHLPI